MLIKDWFIYLFRPRKVPWVCDFAKRNLDHDPHDYHKEAGGDGHPSAFYEYTCWNCNRKFRI